MRDRQCETMVDMPDDSGYLLDNQQVEAGTRFDALAALFDPVRSLLVRFARGCGTCLGCITLRYCSAGVDSSLMGTDR